MLQNDSCDERAFELGLMGDGMERVDKRKNAVVEGQPNLYATVAIAIDGEFR